MANSIKKKTVIEWAGLFPVAHNVKLKSDLRKYKSEDERQTKIDERQKQQQTEDKNR